MLIHWDIDPIIISIGPFALRWYGLLFAAPFLAGFAGIGILQPGHALLPGGLG